MPQELRVLKCYKCNMFQVHVVKKSIQWICKVCGEKQDLTKVYGVGTGRDCRTLVQKLNETSRYQQSCGDIDGNFFLEQKDCTGRIENSAAAEEIARVSESKWFLPSAEKKN